MLHKIFSALLIIIFLSIVFIGLPILVVILGKILGLPVYDNLNLKIIGWIFISIALSVIISSTVLHIKTGRKTPLPVIEKPKKFIASGFYKYSRNPMYLAETFFFVGLFFVFGYMSLLLFSIGFFLVVNVLVIYFEEPEMDKKFGDQYLKYKKEVSRWICGF